LIPDRGVGSQNKIVEQEARIRCQQILLPAKKGMGSDSFVPRPSLGQ
jgi:hypothetical protein